MSFHTRKEFRALCGGILNGYMQPYVTRGNVLVREDGLIDDTDPGNIIFLTRQREKNGGSITVEEMHKIDAEFNERMRETRKAKGKKAKPRKKVVSKVIVEKQVSEVKSVPKVKPKTTNIKKEVRVHKPQKELDFEPGNVSDLDRKKREIEYKIKEKELELKEIEVKKKMGQVIPVDLVQGLVSRHSNNFVTSFKMATDNLIGELQHSFGIDRDTANKYKGLMINIINESITEALETTEQELKGIVSDYKTVR